MVKTIRQNGRLVICVDGHTVLPAAYLSYCPADADYDGFHAAGYRLFSYCIYLGDCPINEENGTLCSWEPGLWRAPDVLDFSPLDAGMARICGADFSREAQVLLRINLNMPAWWRELYPEEIMHRPDRPIMQSIASERWRRDALAFLEKLKAHIQASPYAHAVIGWQVAAMHTEEWIHPAGCTTMPIQDPPMTEAFRTRCAEQYQSLDALNRAWGTSFLDFSEISLPTIEEIRARQEAGVAALSCTRVRDFFNCLSQTYADTIRFFTRAVKALFDGDILCGAFYGYIGQLTDLQGHTALSCLIDEPSIDFFASPFAYNNARGEGVDWIYHAPMESMDRAGKLWFLEADIRTDLTRPLSDSRPDVCPPTLAYFRQAVFFGPDTRRGTINHLLRAFAKCLASRNGFWWFDMWGGWYRDTDIMVLMARLRALYAESVENENVTSVSEVAVVLDEHASTSVPTAVFYESVTTQLIELGFLGAPYDLLLLDRLDEADTARYKLFLLLSPDENSDAYIRCRTLLRHRPGTVRVAGAGRDADAPIYAGAALWQMAEDAGVHLYAKGHIVYANNRWLAITAAHDGDLCLRLPAGQRLCDALSDTPLGVSWTASTDGAYILSLRKNDCRLLKVCEDSEDRRDLSETSCIFPQVVV